MILKLGRLVMLVCIWFAGYDEIEFEKIRVWTKAQTR